MLDAIVEKLRGILVEQPPLPADQVPIRLRETLDKLRQVHQQKTLLQQLAAKRSELMLEEIAKRMDELGREDQRLKMDLVTKDARGEAIRRQIMETRREVEERIANDVVKTQLELAAKLRRKEAETVKGQADAGQPIAPTAHIQALVRVAEAEARVAERQAELGRSAMLERLNDELLGLMIDLAELNARRDVLRKQLPATDLESLTWTHLDQLTRSSQVSPQLLQTLEKQQGELHLQILALRVADAIVVTDQPDSHPATGPSSHPPTTRPNHKTSATPG